MRFPNTFELINGLRVPKVHFHYKSHIYKELFYKLLNTWFHLLKKFYLSKYQTNCLFHFYSQQDFHQSKNIMLKENSTIFVLIISFIDEIAWDLLLILKFIIVALYLSDNIFWCLSLKLDSISLILIDQ